jgi:hypothetical protein
MLARDLPAGQSAMVDIELKTALAIMLHEIDEERHMAVNR